MKIIIPIILMFSVFNSHAQKVEIKIDTNYYKLDEKLSVWFESDFTPDSTFEPTFPGFEIISGPSTNSSISINNGEKTTSYKLLYTLKPSQPGVLKIPSAKFYLNGLPYQAKAFEINIIGKPLTKAEIDKREFTLFVEKTRKPIGTTRILFHENFGYIEEYTGLQWVFKRQLTETELIDLVKLSD